MCRLPRTLFYPILRFCVCFIAYQLIVSVLLPHFHLESSLYAQKRKTIAVIPFKNGTGEIGYDYISTRIAEIVSSDIKLQGKFNVAKISKVSSIVRKNNFSLKHSHLISAKNEKLLSVAKQLNADYVLLGSYSGSYASLYVTMRIVDIKGGKVLDSKPLIVDGNNKFAKIKSPVRVLVSVITNSQGGFVSVNCRPIRSNVYIDGKPVGQTPLLKYPLKAGIHQIEVKKEGYKPLNTTVTIVKDKLKTVSDYLENNAGITKQWGFGIAAYGLWIPHDDFSLAPLLSFVYHNRRLNRLITIDTSYVDQLNHNYEYTVPYGSNIDERYYRLILVGASIHHIFSNRSRKFVPYIGGRLGVMSFTDYRVISDADKELDSNVIFTIGPTIGFAVFSNPMVRWFFEIRYTLPVVEISREKVNSVNLFGNKDLSSDTMYMHMLSFGGGLSVQF